MKHVAPHRWADAFAGKLADTELQAIERHAEDCESCAKARDRVQRASQSFPSLAAQPAPELGWDGVRARVHWAVSSEKRAKTRGGSSRPYAWLAGGALAAGVLGLAIATGSFEAPSPPAPLAKRDTPVLQAVQPDSFAGLVSKLSGHVMIDGVRRDDAFELALVAGTVLATGEGRVDIQFGDRSAFALGPRSTLELRRFEAGMIELVVEGTVDIAIALRTSHQRFVVIAGDRSIEVRGTQFRVMHELGATRVACRHGKVAVRDSHGELEVATALKVELAANATLDAAHVTALSVEELEQLAATTPATLPLWTDAETLLQASAALEVATAAVQAVRVDGVELGEAPLRVRVMPGRHTVETADRAGRFRRAGWVDVEPAKPARIAVQPEATEAPTNGSAARRKQLRAGIDRAKLAQCTRAIKKAGLSAYVAFEISIDTAGDVQFLNVVDSDLPASTRSCVREALADVRFKPGLAATFRDKLSL
jgi:ferric-dicitrate binding protein FerR (iron transport regulator)